MTLNNLRNCFTAIFFLVTLFSCKKEVLTDTTGNTIIAKTLLNVSYGTNPLQAMDVYLPAGRNISTTKVMIMIHGGGWSSGDKSDFASFVDTMQRRLPDYAIFNINYRLSASPYNLFPTQEMDVKASIEFIFNKSVDYQISDKYVLIGASAGGHLAMLQGYKYNVPVKPRAIISFYGPSDLTDMYNNPVGGNILISILIAQAIGKIPAQDPQLYTSSSPVSFITNLSPPTILLHGGMDELVSANQSINVSNKLTAAGVNNQYVFYPSAGHGVWTNTLLFDAFNKIVSFLAANVL
ncbi:MAG: alpha/beta hydrolase [Ferruginibacter sp.]